MAFAVARAARPVGIAIADPAASQSRSRVLRALAALGGRGRPRRDRRRRRSTDRPGRARARPAARSPSRLGFTTSTPAPCTAPSASWRTRRGIARRRRGARLVAALSTARCDSSSRTTADACSSCDGRDVIAGDPHARRRRRAGLEGVGRPRWCATRLVALQRALGAAGRRGHGGTRHRHGGVPACAGEGLPRLPMRRASARAGAGGAARARRGRDEERLAREIAERDAATRAAALAAAAGRRCGHYRHHDDAVRRRGRPHGGDRARAAPSKHSRAWLLNSCGSQAYE